MNRTIQSILLALLPSTILAESLAVPNFDYWYQIEIIIFRQKKPLSSDEIWPLQDISYPPDMVAIAPVSDELITPYSLDQVRNLYQVTNLSNRKSGRNDRDLFAEDFLFKDFLFKDKASVNHNRRLLESKKVLAPVTERQIPDADLPEEIPGPEESSNDNPAAEVPDVSFAMAEALLDLTLPQAYRSLEKETYTMAPIAGSLRRSSKYDLLIHQSWLQPINSTPTPILIQAGNRYDNRFEIDGTLSFSRSRFLHMDANLGFTEFEPMYKQQQFIQTQAISFSNLEKNYPELIEAERHRYTHVAVGWLPLHHSRRMRSSVMHFIDHPYFGLLVKIDRFTYSPEDEAE